VYLDPPYWKQAEGQYSPDPTDLANMPLEAFTEALAELIKQYAEKLKRGRASAHIALLLQPTQWNAPDHRYTDHILDVVGRVNLPVAMRISCPYDTSQVTPQMVEVAKAQRTVLVLTRELVIWEVAP
jgi:hypothetical protein